MGGKGEKAGEDSVGEKAGQISLTTLVVFPGYKICNKYHFKVRRNKFKMAASIKELD